MTVKVVFEWPASDPSGRVIGERLLNEIADLIDQKLGLSSRPMIVVRIAPSGPQTLHERTAEGSIVVELDVENSTYYSQVIYQFAHEYGHVRTNFREEEGDPKPKYKWLDEVFCQMIALWCLRELALRWVKGGSVPGAVGYVTSLTGYLHSRLLEVAIRPESAEHFHDWVASQQSTLAADRYLRALNQAIAAWLLPLFVEHQELWRPLLRWNTWPTLPPGSDAQDCFEAWLAQLNGAELDAGQRIRRAIFGSPAGPQ